MLNENLEYNEYICAPESETPRVQPNLLTNSFKRDEKGNFVFRGLDQVLTMIVRGFLFSEAGKELFDQERVITDEGICAVKVFLNRWCGFQEAETNQRFQTVDDWFRKNPEAEGWLKRFWIYQYCRKEKKRIDAEAGKLWQVCEEKWRKSYHSEWAYQAKSVTFDNVIAGALEKGVLKERYCIVKKEGKNQGRKDMKGLYEYLFCFEMSKPKPNKDTKLKFLRNIIAFLIWREEHSGLSGEGMAEHQVLPREVLMQKLRLFGWYGADDSNGKVQSWYFPQFLWDGESVMYQKSESDYAKFGIRSDYLEHFDFRLIAPEEVEAYQKEYWILKDEGHGKERPFTIVNA